MDLFKILGDSINQHKNNRAFNINNQYYTYSELAQSISNIRNQLSNIQDKNIGLIIDDGLEVYAAIVALWLEGKAYIPIHPEAPKERNLNILNQANVDTVIDSAENSKFTDFKIVNPKKIANVKINLDRKVVDENDNAYILFTSGTTGVPKGVPVTRKNLTAFVESFWELGIHLNEDDRCLQMFEFTFDLSVMCLLLPMLKGACMYTIPKDRIKFMYIYELIEEHDLTFTVMVPSVINYLRPYFDEIHCLGMKYCILAGEALYLNVTEEWSKSIPNARIFNAYGPTEDTIFCTIYEYKRNKENKAYNGVLSIGSYIEGARLVVIDEDKKILPPNEKGELCICGPQLTPGYIKNPTKNKESFFNLKYNGKEERFYKTGDLCIMDEDNDVLYIGRIDFQVQVQGFRVELSEIEFHAKAFLQKINTVAIAYTNSYGNTEIGLVIEHSDFDTSDIKEYLNNNLPYYMIPTHIKFIDNFILNSNGKIDRNALKKLFIKSE